MRTSGKSRNREEHSSSRQFSKVYQNVTAQNEIIGGKIIWSHPAEVHIKDNEFTAAFWAWRKKGWNNPYAVRFPNGYDGRHECLSALWYEDGKYEYLSYIPARKKIYCKVYAALAKDTVAYRMLKRSS